MRFVSSTLELLKLELERELSRLDPAVRPVQVFACAQAALPPAASHRDCVVRVTDLDILAVSNGTAWIRQDTGAAIA